VGIGEIIDGTGGDIYDTAFVAVSYPGGCLDNVQQFEVRRPHSNCSRKD
jgi:hypothetical protein